MSEQTALDLEPGYCAVCGDNATGRYCPAHDPVTCPIPFGEDEPIDASEEKR